MPHKHDPRKITRMAHERGVTPDELINSTVIEAGTVAAAARKLGVSRWTVSRRLRQQGLEVRVCYKLTPIKEAQS